MERKNKQIIGVIAVLLVLNLLLFFWNGSEQKLSYNEAKFAVQDTSSVASVSIGNISLTKQKNWLVGADPADPAFVDHLLNVLLRVRIKKPIGAMPTEGAIEIRVNNNTFHFKPNDTKTRAYFIQDGEGYEMEIPGFSDYIGDIFELDQDQWRDRLVYDGSWRTIQNLTLDYLGSDENDFTISFDKDFFKMEGVARLDTAVMMDYLNQFQYFQANERLREGRVSAMDSLARTQPLAVLTIDDIQMKTPLQFTIFARRPKDGFHLLLDPAGEMIAVDVNRTGTILRRKGDFRASN